MGLGQIQQKQLFTYEWEQQVEVPFADKLRQERHQHDVSQDDWERCLVITDKDEEEIRLQWTLGVLATDFSLLQSKFPIRVSLQESELIVRMTYSSVQPLDSLMFRGEQNELAFPQVLGTEGVGTVELSM